jgi:amino acid transporter
VAGGAQPLACSHEALAHILRSIGWVKLGNLIGLAATIALPSVVLAMMFGQTRIFFTMARDGLLPARFAAVHPRFHTPHVVTLVTGLIAGLTTAFLPVGKLADYSTRARFSPLPLWRWRCWCCAVSIPRAIAPFARRWFGSWPRWRSLAASISMPR